MGKCADRENGAFLFSGTWAYCITVQLYIYFNSGAKPVQLKGEIQNICAGREQNKVAT